MAYIPKNKIQTNLYTNGKEFILLKNNSDYTGPYYKLYNGKYFTGNTPNDPNTLELIAYPSNENDEVSKVTASYYPLFPTPQDYKNGEFIRYFICRRNQPLFVEIDKAEFTKYKQKDSTVFWRTNKPFSLFWKLTGDINQVAQTNKNITELTEQREKVLGLSLFLKEDWTQYYKEKP
jgi:hypothetical protein